MDELWFRVPTESNKLVLQLDTFRDQKVDGIESVHVWFI